MDFNTELLQLLNVDDGSEGDGSEGDESEGDGSEGDEISFDEELEEDSKIDTPVNDSRIRSLLRTTRNESQQLHDPDPSSIIRSLKTDSSRRLDGDGSLRRKSDVGSIKKRNNPGPARKPKPSQKTKGWSDINNNNGEDDVKNEEEEEKEDSDDSDAESSLSHLSFLSSSSDEEEDEETEKTIPKRSSSNHQRKQSEFKGVKTSKDPSKLAENCQSSRAQEKAAINPNHSFAVYKKEEIDSEEEDNSEKEDVQSSPQTAKTTKIASFALASETNSEDHIQQSSLLSQTKNEESEEEEEEELDSANFDSSEVAVENETSSKNKEEVGDDFILKETVEEEEGGSDFEISRIEPSANKTAADDGSSSSTIIAASSEWVSSICDNDNAVSSFVDINNTDHEDGDEKSVTKKEPATIEGISTSKHGEKEESAASAAVIPKLDTQSVHTLLQLLQQQQKIDSKSISKNSRFTNQNNGNRRNKIVKNNRPPSRRARSNTKTKAGGERKKITEDNGFLTKTLELGTFYKSMIRTMKIARYRKWNRTLHQKYQPKFCDVCDMMFFAGDKLNRHNFEEHGGPDFGKWGKKAEPREKRERSTIIKRTLRTSILEPVTCSHCPFKTVTRRTLWIHQRSHFRPLHRKISRCPYCPRVYSQPAPLRNHILTHHDNDNSSATKRLTPGPTEFKCDSCPTRFYTRISLARHILRHSSHATSAAKSVKTEDAEDTKASLSAFGAESTKSLTATSFINQTVPVGSSRKVYYGFCDTCGRKFRRLKLQKHPCIKRNCIPGTLKEFWGMPKTIKTLKRPWNDPVDKEEAQKKGEIAEVDGNAEKAKDEVDSNDGGSEEGLGMVKSERERFLEQQQSKPIVYNYPTPKRDVYPCHLCGKTFTKKASQQKHVDRVHLEVQYCEQCDQNIPRKEAELHAEKHESGIACGTCGWTFLSEGGRRKHVQLKHPEVWSAKLAESPGYQCDKCDQRFTKTYGLRNHRRYSHGIFYEATDPCQCPHCPRRFPKQLSLTRHINKIHVNGIPCKYCGEVLGEQSMDKHIWNFHTAPHPCSLCDRRYGSFESLCRHRREVHPKDAKKHNLASPVVGPAPVASNVAAASGAVAPNPPSSSSVITILD